MVSIKTEIMKTAVEWLEEQYLKRKGFLKTSDVNRAKEMEKEQIIEAYMVRYEGINDNIGEEYYNETFKSE